MPTYRFTTGIPDTCNVICFNGDISWASGTSAESFKLDASNYQNVTDYADISPVPKYIKSVPDAKIINGLLVEATAGGILENGIKGKTALKVAILPALQYEIRANAFQNCTNLTEVILPAKWFNDGALQNKYKIADTAFSGCTKLKCVSLPLSTKSAVSKYLGSSKWGLTAGAVIVCKDGIINI
jgi:hypothetical protein